MKSLFLAGLLAAIARGAEWKKEWLKEEVDALSDTEMKEMWTAWARFFNRDYMNEIAEAHRYGIWVSNLDKIASMNSEGHSFKLALNDFADMTDEEFYDRYECLTREKGTPYQNGLVVEADTSSLPDSVDWTTQGVVTPIKNQGQCGSCWAFSATGDMECEYAIKTGTLNSLSEQELVDCSGSYGNYGCSGGWYYNAWNYAEAEGGLCTEAEYPYTARDGTCKDSTCGTKYNDPSTYSRVTPDSDTSLATASAAGCVSVAIEADQTAFQYYSSGVLTGTCGTSIDHAVLVVGYGTLSGQEYWKVKNSWGTSWGENGYVLICRNCNKNGNRGECGINMYPYVVDY